MERKVIQVTQCAICITTCYNNHHVTIRVVMIAEEWWGCAMLAIYSLGWSEWSSLWLRALSSLLLLGRSAFALSLERAAFVNTFFSLNGSLSYFLMHNLQKSAVTEFQSQQGPRRSPRLRVQAAHKQGQDGHIWPLQFIYTAGIQKHQFHHTCCAKHPTDPWPQGRVKGSIRSTGFYTPSLLMGGPGDIECYVWKESALVPSESAHLLALWWISNH